MMDESQPLAHVPETDGHAATGSGLEWLAQALAARGLAAPSLLFLEMYRPVRGLLAHAVTALAPVLAPAVGLDGCDRLRLILEEPGALDALIARIEELSQATDGPPPPQEAR